MTEPPIACSLDRNALKARLAAAAEVGRAGLISREQVAGRHLLRFRSDAQIRARLERDRQRRAGVLSVPRASTSGAAGAELELDDRGARRAPRRRRTRSPPPSDRPGERPRSGRSTADPTSSSDFGYWHPVLKSKTGERLPKSDVASGDDAAPPRPHRRHLSAWRSPQFPPSARRRSSLGRREDRLHQRPSRRSGFPEPNDGRRRGKDLRRRLPVGHAGPGHDAARRRDVRHRQPNWSPDHSRIAYAGGSGTDVTRSGSWTFANGKPDRNRSPDHRTGPPLLVARRHADRLRGRRRPLGEGRGTGNRTGPGDRQRGRRPRNGRSGARTATPSTTTAASPRSHRAHGTSTRSALSRPRSARNPDHERSGRRLAALPLAGRQNPLLPARAA